LAGTSAMPNFWMTNPRFSRSQLASYGGHPPTIAVLTSNKQSIRTWERKMLKMQLDGITTSQSHSLRSLMKFVPHFFPLPWWESEPYIGSGRLKRRQKGFSIRGERCPAKGPTPIFAPSLLDINCGSTTSVLVYPYACFSTSTDELHLHDLETFALLGQSSLYNYHFFPPLDFDWLERQVAEDTSSSSEVVSCHHEQSLGHPEMFLSSDQSSRYVADTFTLGFYQIYI